MNRGKLNKKRRKKFESLQRSKTRTPEMVTIYRVQDADGRGPWKPGFSHLWIEPRDDSEMRALVPIQTEFPQLRFRHGMHVGCGCVKLDQLRRWFTPGEFTTLRKHGYQCVSMTANRIVAQSEVQAVFERHWPLWKKCKTIALYPYQSPQDGSSS